MKSANPVRSLIAAALLAGLAPTLMACEEQSQWDEAVEEMKDEAGDAKEEIKDEIDDHTSS